MDRTGLLLDVYGLRTCRSHSMIVVLQAGAQHAVVYVHAALFAHHHEEACSAAAEQRLVAKMC